MPTLITLCSHNYSQSLHSFPDRVHAHAIWGEIGPQMKSTGLGTRSHHLETVYTLGQENLVDEQASLIIVMSTVLLCASEL